MKDDNAQLIRSILSGDDNAFTILVKKHQKSVHALIWRKIGDFHVAEEITQDTFLQAYKKLSTLKDPKKFDGWLYVIANRLCINWVQRHKAKLDRLNMQSLERTPVEDVEEASYIHHASERRKAESTDYRREIVKKILATLPESERTVATLHYLGAMTAKEISKFLGVSVNTIKSRLRRAQERLQADKERLVRETLGGVQLPTNLIENIMRQVVDLKPTPPVKNPLLPWAAFGTTAVLVMLLLGITGQYFVRFQQLYSFEAESEPTIEIVDATITLDIVAKPAVRRQVGRATTSIKNGGAGTQGSQTTLATHTLDNSTQFSTSQWIQSAGPSGSSVLDIFATSERTLYAFSPTGIYRLAADETMWTPIDTDIPTGIHRMPMAEHANALYIVSADDVFASTDTGETWHALGPRPKGDAIGLIIIDETQRARSQAAITMYLALRDRGVFRSADAGKQWVPVNSGLIGKRIYAVCAVGNTVFVGTNQGLYRLESESWQQLPLDTSQAVYSLTAAERNLYVGIGPDLYALKPSQFNLKNVAQMMRIDGSSAKRIFHSADFGDSWTEITPPNQSQFMRLPSGIEVLRAGKMLLVLGTSEFRSMDGGKNWNHLGSNMNSFGVSRFPVVAVDEHTFYRTNSFGISRTTDGGETWHPFINGMTGVMVQDLVGIGNKLYMHTGNDIVQSTDGGTSWKSIRFDFDEHTSTSGTDFYINVRLATVNNILYAISLDGNDPYIFRTSAAGDELIRMPGVPAFEEDILSTELSAGRGKAKQTHALTDHQKSHNSKDMLPLIRRKYTKIGEFTVNNSQTFYAEYRGRLFKWKPGNLEWTDTGLIEDNELSNGRFRLAVSGSTVYVGKQNGKLFQSLDGGKTWKDITTTLPISFTYFKEILCRDSTVYVATDKGALVSHNGEYWRVLTEGTRTRIVIDRFAMTDTTIYGVGDTGVYRLDDREQWKQVSSSVPDKVHSLLIGNNRIYIATEYRGMFHTSLEVDTFAKSRRRY